MEAKKVYKALHEAVRHTGYNLELVSVESAKLEGMKDFLVVPKAHTFIMVDDEVLRQVTFFLKNGVFDKGSNQTSNKE